jgi:Ni/Co efflux regulator RcnB
MNRIAILLTITAAVFFTPTDAFAKDKKKHKKDKHRDRHECHDDDRRSSYYRDHHHSGYSSRYHSPYRSSYYAPSYAYRDGYYDRGCDTRRSSSGVRFVFGF